MSPADPHQACCGSDFHQRSAQDPHCELGCLQDQRGSARPAMPANPKLPNTLNIQLTKLKTSRSLTWWGFCNKIRPGAPPRPSLCTWAWPRPSQPSQPPPLKKIQKPTKINLNYTVTGLSKLLLFNAYAKTQSENFNTYIIEEAMKYPYPKKGNLIEVCKVS